MSHQHVKGIVLTILLGIFIAYLPDNWDYIKGEGIDSSWYSDQPRDEEAEIKSVIARDIIGSDSPTDLLILGSIDQGLKKFYLYLRKDNLHLSITELTEDENEQFQIVKSGETSLPVITYQTKLGEKRILFIGGLNQDKRISYIQFQTKDWSKKIDVENQDQFFTSIEIPNSVAEFKDSEFLISYDYGFFDQQEKNITTEVISAFKSKSEIESHD